MQCTEEQAYTYSEILEILNIIDEEYKERIPQKLISIFEESKLTTYTNHIIVDTPLENQEVSDKTAALLALICLNYWCDSENQKEDLKSIFDENEKNYQESLVNKYDPYNIFSNQNQKKQNVKPVENEISNLPIEEESIPFHKQILNKIVNFLKDKFKK